MQRFVWGIVLGMILGFFAFADPGGMRTAMVEKLQEHFAGGPSSDQGERPTIIKGTWPHDQPPVIVP